MSNQKKSKKLILAIVFLVIFGLLGPLMSPTTEAFVHKKLKKVFKPGAGGKQEEEKIKAQQEEERKKAEEEEQKAKEEAVAESEADEERTAGTIDTAGQPQKSGSQGPPLATTEDCSGLFSDIKCIFTLAGVLRILTRIGYLILSFFATAIGIASQLLTIFLHPESVTNNATVVTGWVITRDIANMFFLFIIIIISLGTILGFGDYSAGKLLPKLILFVILINFTRLLAGLVIDFSNVFAQYFIDKAGSTEAISKALAEGLGLSEIFNPNSGGVGDLASATFASLSLFLTIYFSWVLLAVGLFTILAGAIFLFIRQLALWGAVILAPLAFLLGIVPATSEYFKKWWHFLFKWSIFAPVFTFFIYLSVTLINSGAGLSTLEKSATSEASFASLMNTIGKPGVLTSFLFTVGTMVGGLYAALTLGVTGANTVMGWGQSALKGATGAVGGTLGGALRRGYTGKAVEKTGKTLGRIPYVGSYIGTPITQSTLSRAREKENITKESEKWGKLPASVLLQNYEGSIGSRKDAIGHALIKSGQLNNLNPETIQAMVQRLSAFGLDTKKDVAKSRLDVMPDIEGIAKDNVSDRKAVLDRYANQLTSDDYRKINPVTLENSDARQSLIRRADDEKSLNNLVRVSFDIKNETTQNQIINNISQEVTNVAKEKPFMANWQQKDTMGIFRKAGAAEEFEGLGVS